MPEHRPLYHFRPAANWINDPNGLIQWKGQYHLFYQHNPARPFHGVIHWGHAVSSDLVHWRQLPLALSPTSGGPDESGCWSGCAVDNDGIPTLMYTGVRKVGDYVQTQCLATGDDDLLTWHKHPANPVIAEPPPDLDLIAFRDPYVWKKGALWQCVIGTGIKDHGGALLLYSSADLEHWTFERVLFSRSALEREPVWTGAVWECPQFFRLGGSQVLIMSIWDEQKLNYPVYAIGTYDDQTFAADTLCRLDLGPEYYAPATCLDERGRRLVWGWIWEARSQSSQRAAGWAGVMSLPRVLTLHPDNTLGIAPAPELQSLRGSRDRRTNLTVAPGSSSLLEGIQGDALEILVEVDLAATDATEIGLLLRCSPDMEECTRVVYNRLDRSIHVDREHASRDPNAWRGVHGGVCPAATDSVLKLRVFLDRSVLEVFVDDRTCLTARIYPVRPDSMGVGLFSCQGSLCISTLDTWWMQPSPVDAGS